MFSPLISKIETFVEKSERKPRHAFYIRERDTDKGCPSCKSENFIEKPQKLKQAQESTCKNCGRVGLVFPDVQKIPKRTLNTKNIKRVPKESGIHLYRKSQEA
jgi:hypothetical protein